MSRVRFVREAVLVLALSVVSTGVFAQAQPATKPFQPSVGQPGKDVVWVPTPDALVAKMLDLAKVTPQDYVIDLGSGDGRTVIAAAKRGAKALGVEYNPDMVELSKKNAVAAGVTPDKASFMQADLFVTDFSQATVVTMFLLPTINLRLRPTILNMKPGTRVVSNTFTMEEWQPDDTAEVSPDQGCTAWCRALFWVVPAKVEGTWKVGDSDLTLKQTFQMLSGTLRTGGASVDITDARLRGDEIQFTAGGAKYTGKVTDAAMQGTMTGGRTGNWSATRAR